MKAIKEILKKIQILKGSPSAETSAEQMTVFKKKLDIIKMMIQTFNLSSYAIRSNFYVRLNNERNTDEPFGFKLTISGMRTMAFYRYHFMKAFETAPELNKKGQKIVCLSQLDLRELEDFCSSFDLEAIKLQE